MRALAADVVAAGTRSQRQGVGDGDVAARRTEHCPHHEAVADVLTLGREVVSGTKRPVAGFGVEEAAKHRRGVEARHAPPVDGAGPVDKRGGVAVGQEAVVRDAGDLADSPLAGGVHRSTGKCTG